jgi:hypothetical protein
VENHKRVEDLSSEKQKQFGKILEEYSMILHEMNLFIEVNKIDYNEAWDRANQQYDDDMSYAPENE